MDIAVEFTAFAPKELTAITGLSLAMQRDWRRSGYLPPRETGWATFSLRDIAGIALRKVLADSGLGPGFGNTLLTHPSADLVVNSIVWWAVEADAISGWITQLPESLAAEVTAFDNDDHFGLVGRLTGQDSRKRALTVQIDPIGKQVSFNDECRPDHADESPLLVTLRLDAIGRQITQRAERSLLTLRSAYGDVRR